jgi:hypothetical protein
MIIFFGKGRLGNQLFQYAFLKSIKQENEIIFSDNFAELLKLFDIDDRIINLNCKIISKFNKTIFVPILKWLSARSIISSYRINKKKVNGFRVSDDTYTFKRGLLPLTYVYPSYFQSEAFFGEDFGEKIQIKNNYIKRAKKFIDQIPSGCQIFFVHIRRTDYLDHLSLGIRGIELPFAYYKKQINHIKKRVNRPFFVFLGDDKKFIQDNFSYVNNKIISNNDMFTDFAIMTLCDGGILSNSTFCWWGAYFNNMDNNFFIAPKYWLGFKSKKEVPIGITPSFASIKLVKT